MDVDLLLDNFAAIVEAPGGTRQLHRLVLDLAVSGRLVVQNEHDEPASTILALSEARKKDLIARELVPKPRALTAVDNASPIEQFSLPASWQWTTLEDVAAYIQRGKGPKYAKSPTSVPVISQKCIQWSGFDLGPARYVDESSLEGYGVERYLQPGDLLWNSTGTGTVGRVALFPSGLSHRIVADSHVTVVRLAACSPRYVWTWLASTFVQSRMERLTSGTTNQQELNVATVRRMPVPIPPLAEQNRIVETVDELVGLCDRLQAAKEARSRSQARLADRLTRVL
ncbi:MAG: restriction endonuclease subunit S [Roseovarius sp.]|jgi:type I restriction enzyme S subunit|nr:restriction endonuclease subunit S [Roseovarius sp.]